MTYVVKVSLKLHWGFSIKKPTFSASEPCYKIPPPTTLIGALAKSLHYIEESSEILVLKNGYCSSTAALLDYCIWASLAIKDENIIPRFGPPVSTDISRILLAPYVRAEHSGKPIYKFAVQPHGKVYAPGFSLEIAYFSEKREKAEKIFKLSWLLTSLGSKESIVSVNDVRILKVKIKDEMYSKTSFYFPAKLGEVLSENFIVEELSLPSLEWYKIGVKDVFSLQENFIVPTGSVNVKILEEGLILTDGEDEYIVPRDLFYGDGKT